jgi:hypothetical protein
MELEHENAMATVSGHDNGQIPGFNNKEDR